MPTILKYKKYRFFFYSNDHEPKHIHIEKDEKTAKFKIETIELIKSNGFNSLELKRIRILIENNHELFNQKWNEFFDNK